MSLFSFSDLSVTEQLSSSSFSSRLIFTALERFRPAQEIQKTKEVNGDFQRDFGQRNIQCSSEYDRKQETKCHR